MSTPIINEPFSVISPEYNGIEEYHGYRISWDISRIDGTELWKSTAAIVQPAEPPSRPLPTVTEVPGIPERFSSENEAREITLKLAREFVDKSHSENREL
jgi:hypothetical protein